MAKPQTWMWRGSLSVLAVCALSCAPGDRTEGDRDGDSSQGGGNTNVPAGGAAGAGGAAPDFGNSGSGAPVASPTTPIMDGLDGETCARADVHVERVRPRIVFLVDGSSSMSEELGDATRWDALRESLLDDDGLIPSLQQIVKFGLVTYEGPRYTTCPSFRYAAPAPSNFDLVDAAFPDAPPEESSTPTGPAMDWAIDHAFLDQVPGPDVAWEPQFMIFATDGEPNGCATGASDEPARDFDGVLAAAHKAAGRGIDIFVISLAEADGEFADHLLEVAEIGGTDEVYSPASKTELVSELQRIIGAAISCEVELTAGRVGAGNECKGEVTLDGEPLTCNGDDGWALVDEKHIVLKGQACEDFKLTPSASVSAIFPCEALL
jgi:hypothetical protein